jgi:hypothetical protein
MPFYEGGMITIGRHCLDSVRGMSVSVVIPYFFSISCPTYYCYPLSLCGLKSTTSRIVVPHLPIVIQYDSLQQQLKSRSFLTSSLVGMEMWV